MKRIVAAVSLWFVFAPVSGLAQTSFGTITGIIRDASGAVLPNVNITATNEQTGLSRQATTDANGAYTVPSLPPAIYTITAELKDFKKGVAAKVNLEVQQTLRRDITLVVGEISQTMEVQAEAPLLQSESSTVGTVITNKQVIELPLNGRSFTELTKLIPGAVSQEGALFQVSSGSRVSVSGARAEDNNYTLDGVNNNETFFKAFAVQPSIDAIQEFKIQTNITSAEFGQAAGANINVVTKSGTNEIHGVLFEFLRNNVFDARDAFAPTRPTFRQNQFGGQAGGPAIRNQTFWFFNYEGFRNRRAATALGTIPTPEMFNGNLAFDPTGAPATPIFDPATTRLVNGLLVRDPFPETSFQPTASIQLSSPISRCSTRDQTCPGKARTLSTHSRVPSIATNSRFASIIRSAKKIISLAASPMFRPSNWPQGLLELTSMQRAMLSGIS